MTTPKLEPSLTGLTTYGGLHRMLRTKALAIHHQRFGNRNTGGGGHVLGLRLVHGERGGQNAGMGVGNFQIFENALDRAVLAERTVKGVEGDVRAQRGQNRSDIARDVYTRNAETFRFQSIGACSPGRQAHRSLRRKSAHKDSYMLAVHSYPRKYVTIATLACAWLIPAIASHRWPSEALERHYS